jgi:hypothetical protein
MIYTKLIGYDRSVINLHPLSGFSTRSMSDILKVEIGFSRQSQEQDLKDRLWHKGSTPIKINVLEQYLAEYNNRGKQSYY